MYSPLSVFSVFAVVLFLWGCQPASGKAATKVGSQSKDAACDVSFVILGTGQDAGAPQIGNPDDPAWTDASKRMLATSAAVLDHRSGRRYLFEATPDIREQMQILDGIMPDARGSLGLSGAFLTHAHIGHYAGLMFFGRESAGAKNIPVYAMPRMAEFLKNNGPWDQLVALENIDLMPISGQQPVILPGGIVVEPAIVPHRDEYSETVAFLIAVEGKLLMFLPDIDSLEISDDPGFIMSSTLMEKLDYLYLDATFYDDNELPGRDMSKIPHPRVKASMDFFDNMGDVARGKVRFIHLNHTNPARFEDSPEARYVKERGYHIAKRGEQVCLLLTEK